MPNSARSAEFVRSGPEGAYSQVRHLTDSFEVPSRLGTWMRRLHSWERFPRLTLRNTGPLSGGTVGVNESPVSLRIAMGPFERCSQKWGAFHAGKSVWSSFEARFDALVVNLRSIRILVPEPDYNRSNENFDILRFVLCRLLN